MHLYTKQILQYSEHNIHTFNIHTLIQERNTGNQIHRNAHSDTDQLHKPSVEAFSLTFTVVIKVIILGQVAPEARYLWRGHQTNARNL